MIWENYRKFLAIPTDEFKYNLVKDTFSCPPQPMRLLLPLTSSLTAVCTLVALATLFDLLESFHLLLVSGRPSE